MKFSGFFTIRLSPTTAGYEHVTWPHKARVSGDVREPKLLRKCDWTANFCLLLL